MAAPEESKPIGIAPGLFSAEAAASAGSELSGPGMSLESTSTIVSSASVSGSSTGAGSTFSVVSSIIVPLVLCCCLAFLAVDITFIPPAPGRLLGGISGAASALFSKVFGSYSTSSNSSGLEFTTVGSYYVVGVRWVASLTPTVRVS